MGVKVGGNHTRIDLNSLELDDQNDPSFNVDNIGKFMPNFGFGFYYYTTKWYLGVSSPQLVNYDFNSSQRHYFVRAGAVLKITDNLKIRPSSFLKFTKNAASTLDLTGLLIFRDETWAGFAFRAPVGIFVPTGSSGGGYAFLVGLNLSDQLSVGYSFGYSVGNQTFKFNNGSHEITLRYDHIYESKKIIKSPRYF
jgi:type IX secretion system PorP/SprF family membrane protein